jgi:hypothetical protein
MLLRRVLPVAHQSSAHPFPIYEMGPTRRKQHPFGNSSDGDADPSNDSLVQISGASLRCDDVTIHLSRRSFNVGGTISVDLTLRVWQSRKS